MHNKTQEPLLHITRRDSLPWLTAMGIRLCSLVIALLVCALISVVMTGENPLSIYQTILYGSFGTTRKFWVTLQNIAMLLCLLLP